MPGERPMRFERLCFRALAEGRDLRSQGRRTARTLGPRTQPPDGRNPRCGGCCRGLSVVKVLVSDTSVLIDLDRGSLVEPAFRLPFGFTVPDLLYERELKAHGGPDLIRLMMRPVCVGEASFLHHRITGYSI